MEDPIINKVAQSGIITLDLEELYPPGERVVFDLKPLLWQEIALKEDDLRAFVKDANADVKAEFRKRAEGAWSVLNAHLEGRRYVVGDRLTYGDLSLCGYAFFDDEIGVDWATYPNIRAWLDRIRGEPGWRHPYDLMPGHPLPAAAA